MTLTYISKNSPILSGGGMNCHKGILDMGTGKSMADLHSVPIQTQSHPVFVPSLDTYVSYILSHSTLTSPPAFPLRSAANRAKKNKGKGNTCSHPWLVI